MNPRLDVLIVGAGPTGLALALHAHDHGARVRVVERRIELGRPSRAMIVHPRSLEVLRPLGITDALLGIGQVSPTVALHTGRRVVRVSLGSLRIPDTSFPFLLFLRQSDLETVLAQAAAARGIDVERGTEFRGYQLDHGLPVAELMNGTGVEEAPCRYLVGCDGASSSVRRAAGVDFVGAPYAVDIVLADVELDADPGDASTHAVVSEHGLTLIFPLGERASWRLLASVPSEPSGEPFGAVGAPVAHTVLSEAVRRSRLPIEVRDVAWSSRVRLQHRVVSRYRRGPVILAGDAAHAFSPAGGQGMNTGLQDAANLGWKLAAATPGSHGDRLLDSYECERRPVAQRTEALTHALFWGESSPSKLAAWVRRAGLPMAAPLIPAMMRREHLVAAGVRVISQLRCGYPQSPLSVDASVWRPGVGSRDATRPGRRLADETVVIDAHNRRLHDALATAGAHILLANEAIVDDESVVRLKGPGVELVHVHRVQSWRGSDAVVVRPDGHIGYRGPTNGLMPWLDQWLGQWVVTSEC